MKKRATKQANDYLKTLFFSAYFICVAYQLLPRWNDRSRFWHDRAVGSGHLVSSSSRAVAHKLEWEPVRPWHLYQLIAEAAQNLSNVLQV